jgi:anti-sigma factor RsiW
MDGELSTDRAREVERQIAAEPELRREFQRLQQDDARWRRSAQNAAFQPAVRLPRAGQRRLAAAAALVLLLALRLEGKVTDSVLGFGMHGVALACLIVALVWLTRDDDMDVTRTGSLGERAW